MKLKYLFILFLIPLFIGQSFGQDANQNPIITDRPSFGTGTAIVPLGALQLETGFQFTTLNSSIPGNVAPGLKFEIFNFNNTLLRYGISEKIELRFTQNVTKSRFRLDGQTTEANETMLSPTAIGTKINLVKDNDDLPDISFLANVGGQVFSDDGSGSYLDATILLSNTIFNDFGMDVNFGTAWLNGLSTLSYQYAFGLARSISDKLGFYIESYGILPEDARFEEHNINGGLNYLLNNTTQVDFYGGTGFSKFSPNIFIGFGFSKIFQ